MRELETNECLSLPFVVNFVVGITILLLIAHVIGPVGQVYKYHVHLFFGALCKKESAVQNTLVVKRLYLRK